jgi:CcmD family protein
VADNLGYLFAAYTAVWLGIFVYVRRLARRGRELEDEIRDLRRRIES